MNLIESRTTLTLSYIILGFEVTVIAILLFILAELRG